MLASFTNLLTGQNVDYIQWHKRKLEGVVGTKDIYHVLPK